MVIVLPRILCTGWRRTQLTKRCTVRLAASSFLPRTRLVSSYGHPPPPTLDWDYLCHAENAASIQANITNRNGCDTRIDLNIVREMYSKWTSESDLSNRSEIYNELVSYAREIPNRTHPNTPIGDESQAVTVETFGERRTFDFKAKSVVDLGESLGHLRCDHTAMTTGPRTYYFMDAFAKLQAALIRYTLTKAVENGFELVSVPEIVPDHVIECAGFKTTGERTQVYRLAKRDVENEPYTSCLVGSAEMSLVGFMLNQHLHLSQLPKKLVAVSRCYRAETGNVSLESGIYRVHQFHKVELFGITANETEQESEKLFREIVGLQKHLFSELGLHFRILNMPTEELGAPAYCKYDIEAWMPNKEFWGEISSTSNCTDFQSRRMHLTYTSADGMAKRHCHTVNGTGCAVPRMIMALVENNQNKDEAINIPAVLRPYMNGQERIVMSEKTVRPRWIRSKKH